MEVTAVVAQLLSAVVGIWLLIASAVLDYGGLAADVEHVIGPLITSLALVAAWEVTRPLRWLNVVNGACLLIAPLLLGYTTAAMVNSLVTGALVAALSTRGGSTRRAVGGGWRALTKESSASPR